jgi:hypothetical protein
MEALSGAERFTSEADGGEKRLKWLPFFGLKKL